EETMFVLVWLQPGASIANVKRGLQARMPNIDVWTRDEFSRKARFYWITQTGAGGAILTAALLGFFIGLAVVSQAIYATTMENIEEFATLKALGASNGFIRRVIVSQAVVCGIAGYFLGLVITSPMIRAAQSNIPWVSAPAWLPVAVVLPTLAMCVPASIISVRTALAVE